jgi:hypothetical protein
VLVTNVLPLLRRFKLTVMNDFSLPNYNLIKKVVNHPKLHY